MFQCDSENFMTVKAIKSYERGQTHKCIEKSSVVMYNTFLKNISM